MKTFKQQEWNKMRKRPLDVTLEKGTVSVDGHPASTPHEKALGNIIMRLNATANHWRQKAEDAERRAKEAEGDQKIVARILKSGSLEHGWHGNPDNHTMNVTLFFGDRDPSPIVESDKFGPKLTRKFLEFFVGDKA